MFLEKSSSLTLSSCEEGDRTFENQIPFVSKDCLRLETAYIEIQFCCKVLAVIVSIQSRISFRRESLFAFNLTSQVERKELSQNIQETKREEFSTLINRQQKYAPGLNLRGCSKK